MGLIERVLPKLFLFVLLLIGMFFIRPDGTTKSAMCSLGYDSYCTPEWRAINAEKDVTIRLLPN